MVREPDQTNAAHSPLSASPSKYNSIAKSPPPIRPIAAPQDIRGTGSIRLHKDTNKPDRQLYHDDIEGSNPRNKWLFRTRRCVNPLEPEYTLPSFVTAPAVAPKFTRDSYDVSDIEGTKSRPLYPLEQRQSHLVDDIEVRYHRLRYVDAFCPPGLIFYASQTSRGEVWCCSYWGTERVRVVQLRDLQSRTMLKRHKLQYACREFRKSTRKVRRGT